MTNSHNKVATSSQQAIGLMKGHYNIATERVNVNNTLPQQKQRDRRRLGGNRCKNICSKEQHNVLLQPNNVKGNKPDRIVSSVIGGNRTTVTNVCSSPPNFAHFAASKCYEAPAPTALPKPPHHWTTCAMQSPAAYKITKCDAHTYNLKLILNVKA
jgi:hypothetical protein